MWNSGTLEQKRERKSRQIERLIRDAVPELLEWEVRKIRREKTRRVIWNAGRGRSPAPLSPAFILLQLQSLRFQFNASYRGVLAEFLELRGVELPTERGARFGQGCDAVFEDEANRDFRVADLLVQGVAEHLEKGR